MAHDVFISYSSRNKPVADAICAGLEADNLRCWIAPRDVLPGHNYGESIVHAIAGCRVMVLVFSEATNVSQAVIREAERAMHHAKPIIPFRIEDTPMSPGLEFFLASCHWLDAIQPPMDRHIAHLSRSIRSLIAGSDPVAVAESPPPQARPPAGSIRKLPVIAGVVVLAMIGGFLAWKTARKPAVEPPGITRAVPSSGIALAVSLSGEGNSPISGYFAGGPRYQSSETGGRLSITTCDTPVPGKVTVVAPEGDGAWLAMPPADLDVKVINNGGSTVFFQRVVLDVDSSSPETGVVWLLDGTRLPGTFAVRPLTGDADSEPAVRIGIAGPEDVVDPGVSPPTVSGRADGKGSWEFPVPRGPRRGIEEVLFGKVDDVPFEIPFGRVASIKNRRSGADPAPLYTVGLRERGEHYTVSCDLSQSVQAGAGDRFFLRLDSPVIGRHRFTITLEYDDGSGGVRTIKGPVVDAGLVPVH